jgi:hypothetical protein
MIEAHLRGWTADGLVRQAAFKGTREDKSPQEVVRETPVMTEAGPAAKIAPKIAAETAKAMTRTSKTKVQPSAVRSSSRRQQGGKHVRFTHPTASIGLMPASPSRIWRTIIVRSGIGWRRTSSAGRSLRCAVPMERAASAASKRMPGLVSPRKICTR